VAQIVSRLDDLGSDQLVELLRKMFLIRAFDKLLPDLYTAGLTRGSSHSAIGQEAVAVGACAALAPDDYITSTHRGHGHAIAKGADPDRMMAELLGRRSGYCQGKGGSMHIADFSIGMLGANGIVGGGFGLAAGAALSASVLANGRVTICFFGEGALNQGAFLECGNLAALWKLPLVLLCENNQYAMSARPEATIAVKDLTHRGMALGIPSEAVDGMDVLAVRRSVLAATERARAGDGPTLLIATCYRLAGHFSGDSQNYRSREEVRDWWSRDPILLFRRQLVAAKVLSNEAIDELEQEATRHMSEAVERVKLTPFPNPRDAQADVYA
jgi:TPP-dependent pyruvate/acetoin dehydrogenase alpha subunit